MNKPQAYILGKARFEKDIHNNYTWEGLLCTEEELLDMGAIPVESECDCPCHRGEYCGDNPCHCEKPQPQAEEIEPIRWIGTSWPTSAPELYDKLSQVIQAVNRLSKKGEV